MYDQMNVEDELYKLRPMNCPYHILVYKRKPHSYHEFPIRVAELGAVYRYELSGSLPGLFRVRSFTQDDAHIFCLEDQIKDEIRGVLDLTEELLLQFGFSKYEVNLSTRPEKAVGDDDIWVKLGKQHLPLEMLSMIKVGAIKLMKVVVPFMVQRLILIDTISQDSKVGSYFVDCGTLSIIFNNFTGGRTFSEVVVEAKPAGYTQTDPKDGLSGADDCQELYQAGVFGCLLKGSIG
ncbi:hypothetical protein C1H46_015726 [Malus baccata]|uniref:threonine--tRNA ligase n=1 Tax=Malus baccata TaxID=106549 RepID=A0A540MJP6_MALBA|nr:hypothetical protein C1H46_015726 [Malus baccata]